MKELGAKTRKKVVIELNAKDALKTLTQQENSTTKMGKKNSKWKQSDLWNNEWLSEWILKLEKVFDTKPNSAKGVELELIFIIIDTCCFCL